MNNALRILTSLMLVIVIGVMSNVALAVDTNTSSTVVTDKAPPSGITVTDENCERLKLARSMYGMGMKVAGVALLCQDARVFDAMWMAGTPCPYKGSIGDAAQVGWLENPGDAPDESKYVKKKVTKTNG